MSTVAQLENLLDQELEIARALASTLENERKALVSDQAHAIADIASNKAALLERLEKLESQRRNLVAQEQPQTEDDADALTRTMTGISSAVGRRWQSLMGLVAACRDANEANGLIVNLRQGQVRQLLDIVRGNTAPVTYGPQGRTFAKAVRPLARA